MASKEEIIEAFKLFDTDGSGFITTDEIKKALADIGEEVSDEEIKKNFQIADKNGDGRISIDEFCALYFDE